MRVKTVKFGMLRTTRQFENDRTECEVELAEGDSVAEAYDLAIASCAEGLGLAREVEHVQNVEDLVEIVADPAGRAAFARFVKQHKRVRP